MYLEKLNLTNFKCFANQSLYLSKITVLLGANSSGKSSLIQGVLAAAQTDLFPVVLSTNGMFVDLGDFKSVVTRHAIDHNVGVSLEFRGDGDDRARFSGTFKKAKRSGMPELVSAEMGNPAFEVRISRRGTRYRTDWSYKAEADVFRRGLNESSEFRRVFEAIAELAFSAPKRSKQNKTPEREQMKRFIAGTAPSSGYFTSSTAEDALRHFPRHLHFTLAPLVMVVLRTMRTFRDSFNYVGPFRIEPKRSYFQVSKDDFKVMRDGQNSIEQIMSWQQTSTSHLRQLVTACSRLGLLSHVHAGSLRSGLFEVRVRSIRSGIPVSLPDVGFGVGQILPILVAEIQLPKGGTLAVSQPEIHLHPSAQADLADHFVRGIHSRGTRYIVETHSEYFFNRLRLLIAQDKLSTDDVSVVYLTNNGSQVTTYNIRFLPDGRIEGAPEEFFKTYMMDVMNIALSAKKQ
jgi:hypothetical protein